MVGLAVAAAVLLADDRSRVTWLIVVAMVALGVLVHAYLIRPRLCVTNGRLELVNPWTVTRIPLARIGLVLVHAVTYVYVGEDRYVGVAVGRTTRDLALPEGLRGSRSMLLPRAFNNGEPKTRDKEAESTERQLSELARSASPEGLDWPVTRTVSWPRLAALGVVVAVWLIVWALG